MRGPLLFVEDDESFRTTVARHLRRRGLPVVEACSTEEADRLLAAGLRPGIVLLDLNLPGDAGWELIRGGRLAEAGDPPVVVLSAITVTAHRLQEHRVAGYLPKPFPLEALVDTVERLLTREALPTEP